MIKHFVSKQFLKYVLIGILGTSLDFLLLYVLVEEGHTHYVLSAIISASLVIWLSFTLNKYWTFENREKDYLRQFFKYLASHSIGYLINLMILVILVEGFGLWYIFAKVFATAAALIWNFLVTKKWVFLEGKWQKF